MLFLIHFAFFLKIYKNEKNTLVLQEIYDFVFRQLELSVREIGYGDQSINKKMKDYINLFHSIISEIHYWNDLIYADKKKKISPEGGQQQSPEGGIQDSPEGGHNDRQHTQTYKKTHTH